MKYNVLNKYAENKFKCIKTASGGKAPVDSKWTSIECDDVLQWNQWLTRGYNLGIRTGEISDLTVIDIDQKVIPKELEAVLVPTLMQISNKGYHFFYKFEKTLTSTRLNEYKVDILNNGRQVVSAPSMVDGIPRKFRNLDMAVNRMTPRLIAFLKREKVPLEDKVEVRQPPTSAYIPKGLRSNTLVQLGGILRKKLNMEQTSYVLSMINTNFTHDPISNKEIWAMSKSLHRYFELDIDAIARKVLEYLKLVDSANIFDIKDYVKEEREVTMKAIQVLLDQGWLIKHRKEYRIIKKLTWHDKIGDHGAEVPFKIPYFHDKAYFCYGDILLIGASTGVGKTTIAMNLVHRLVNTGIKPYYIATETGGDTLR